MRSADYQHIRWCKHWYDAVCKEFEEEQITRKAKGEKGIILIQIENEYNHHDCENKEELLKALYQSVRNSKIDIPVFTCLTQECRYSKDPELSQVFDSDNYYVGLSSAPDCAYRMLSLKQAQPDAPGFVTELQGGWFSLVTGRLSDEHYSDARHFRALGLMSILGGASGLNYYMYFGGSHFDGWGARGMTTSYDYNAAIRENRATSDKYFESKALGEFLQKYGTLLARSEGGPCMLENAPKNLFGGMRVAKDGTRFIFLHNTDSKQPLRGKVKVVPGKLGRQSELMYNINQHGEKVKINAVKSEESRLQEMKPIDVVYDLPALGTKVWVIPAGASDEKGSWWPKPQVHPKRPSRFPQSIRVASVWRKEDAFAEADWKSLSQLVSLSDLDVNDFRYTLYRAQVHLNAQQAVDEHFLLFNMYTRDIVSVQVMVNRLNDCSLIRRMHKVGLHVTALAVFVTMSMIIVLMFPDCCVKVIMKLSLCTKIWVMLMAIFLWKNLLVSDRQAYRLPSRLLHIRCNGSVLQIWQVLPQDGICQNTFLKIGLKFSLILNALYQKEEMEYSPRELLMVCLLGIE